RAIALGFAGRIRAGDRRQPGDATRTGRPVAAIFHALAHPGRRGTESRTRRLESRRRLRGDMIKEKKIETPKISDDASQIPRSKLEENGHSLLIVDLLRLPRAFSYRRYRLDVIGFLLAWLWVALLLALGYLVARIGA